jgi:hypothetical protein
MVNVDRVYQRVLVLANKEQRGYITPQEFNLLANQAQMDTFEQYFYDLNQFRKLNGNDTVHSDMVTILEEKLSQFQETQGSNFMSQLTPNGIGFELPDNLYRLDQIRLGPVQCERLNARDYNEVRMSPLTRPTPTRPIYTLRGGNILIINNGTPVDIAEENDDGDLVNPSNMSMIRTPNRASWGFTMVNGIAIYNDELSVNFELHTSEETDLVIKILALAGITIKDQGLYQIAAGVENNEYIKKKQK